jgi:hypothetical protein
VLAARFGGTPWEWRERAEDEDWGTCLELLRKERDESE